MKLQLYTVNAFADSPFTGNPAAVCTLDQWLDSETMQSIAEQNNLSETAFVVAQSPGKYGIRWFTPTVEVPLCGHATLAAAFVLKSIHKEPAEEILFDSRSGLLSVKAGPQGLVLDLPSDPPKPVRTPNWFGSVFGANPSETLEAAYLLAIFTNQSIIEAIAPDFAQLALKTGTTVIVSAPGDQHDFVSRYFAPCHGINEDPVTGSAHCILTPYWTKRLKKNILHARQVSRRGGELICELNGNRVLISGHSHLYGEGTIHL